MPSIHKVAMTLGVDPMAIYYYFPNKSALLNAVTAELMQSIYMPCGQKSWQEGCLLLCKSYLNFLYAHSGILETMLAMTDDGPAQVFTKRFMKIITPIATLPAPCRQRAVPAR
ncbi:TetR/AcrR family transcriptional regulator [Desulfosediminicola sp.]|uniref:TetR/AcrR family transcriptional regulator n=1 Tax=Desulfosediminicola sp. TaxID=2886825 RepID=UPI003AF21D88